MIVLKPHQCNHSLKIMHRLRGVNAFYAVKNVIVLPSGHVQMMVSLFAIKHRQFQINLRNTRSSRLVNCLYSLVLKLNRPSRTNKLSSYIGFNICLSICWQIDGYQGNIDCITQSFNSARLVELFGSTAGLESKTPTMVRSDTPFNLSTIVSDH